MQYSDFLYATCLRYMSNSADARDVLQDSYIKIFKAIGNFDPNKGALKSWMCKICINTALKKLHRSKLTTDIEEISNVVSIDARYATDMEVEYMFAIIKDLPEQYRTVFNLYIIEGYSHKEIGKILNMKEASSRSVLSRAKEILRKKIELVKKQEAWI